MVQRVFQYLQGTKHYTLNYIAQKDSMQAYSDASLSDCGGSLTTCGHAIQLLENTVAWKTHKQSSVALSTCQAEYVAMSETCQEVISLHNSVQFILRKKMFPIELFCDNLAAQSRRM